jgi:hypothetical protein
MSPTGDRSGEASSRSFDEEDETLECARSVLSENATGGGRPGEEAFLSVISYVMGLVA